MRKPVKVPDQKKKTLYKTYLNTKSHDQSVFLKEREELTHYFFTMYENKNKNQIEFLLGSSR